MAKENQPKTQLKPFEHEGKFWKRSVFIKGIGTVSGLVKQDAWEGFETAMLSIPESNQVKKFDPDDYLSKTDVHKKWNEAHQKKTIKG